MIVHVQENTLPVLLGLHLWRESLASWELLAPPTSAHTQRGKK